MNDENGADAEKQLLRTRVQELESQIREVKERDPDIIDLGEVWNKLWSDKWMIMIIGSVVVLSSIVYALSLSDEYKSQVLLAPVTETAGKGGALSKLAGKFGGLASLAGINLGNNGDKNALAIETIKSRDFLIQFIKDNNLLVPLVAAEKWDRGTNSLIIDNTLYDEVDRKWIREVSPPKQTIPSSLEARELLLERLTINKDDETGYVTISIEFYSPYLAKKWLDSLVKTINDTIRRQDILEASTTISYLQRQVSETTISEMKSVFFELIENQTQTLMLANVREEYVFKTIDPAFVPEEKSNPKRPFIVILAAFFGGILGATVSLVRRRTRVV